MKQLLSGSNKNNNNNSCANTENVNSFNNSNNNQSVVSEWEDSVIFDLDDPDFCNATSGAVVSALNITAATNRTLHIKVPTATAKATQATMSLARVHGPQFADICSPLGHSSLGLSASLPDLVGSPLEISVDNVLTIEELRQHMGSCFTCGVSWTDDHVSLDCSECGGYSMERPCPLCDGQCGVQWKRDYTMSHACSKARWVGVCTNYPEAACNLVAAPVNAATAAAVNVTSCASAAATQLRLAQELCSRLEQLSTSTNRI